MRTGKTLSMVGALFLIIGTSLTGNAQTVSAPTAPKNLSVTAADLLIAKREKINLNSGWTFYKGDTTGAVLLAAQDAQCQAARSQRKKSAA